MVIQQHMCALSYMDVLNVSPTGMGKAWLSYETTTVARDSNCPKLAPLPAGM